MAALISPTVEEAQWNQAVHPFELQRVRERNEQRGERNRAGQYIVYVRN